MKNVLIVIVTCLFSMQLFAQEEVKIGEIKGGKNTITSDISVIKKEWVKLIETQGYPNTLDSWTIVTDKDKSNGEIYHMLLAVSADKTVKVASILSLKIGSFYINKVDNGNVTYTTTICAGCNVACSPVHENGVFICTECPTGNYECSKSSSITNVK